MNEETRKRIRRGAESDIGASLSGEECIEVAALERRCAAQAESIRESFDLIAQAVQIMTTVQLGKWNCVRAWQESPTVAAALRAEVREWWARLRMLCVMVKRLSL